MSDKYDGFIAELHKARIKAGLKLHLRTNYGLLCRGLRAGLTTDDTAEVDCETCRRMIAKRDVTPRFKS